MRVAWVCPFSRPGNAALVRANLARQMFRDFTAVIVENGEAVGAWGDAASNELVLRSGKHQALAKNVALDWCYANGITHVCTLDDDDWYGAQWLARCVAVFEDGAQATGQSSWLVQLTDGSLWRAKHHNPRPGARVQGGTLGFALDAETPRFECCVADELPFQDALARLGRLTHCLEPGDYVYRRHTGHHVWSISDERFVQRMPCYPIDDREREALLDAGFFVQLDVASSDVRCARASEVPAHERACLAVRANPDVVPNFVGDHRAQLLERDAPDLNHPPDIDSDVFVMVVDAVDRPVKLRDAAVDHGISRAIDLGDRDGAHVDAHRVLPLPSGVADDINEIGVPARVDRDGVRHVPVTGDAR